MTGMWQAEGGVGSPRCWKWDRIVLRTQCGSLVVVTREKNCLSFIKEISEHIHIALILCQALF